MKPSPRKENGRSLKIALCFYAIHFSGCRWLTKAVWTTQRLTRTRGCKRSHAFRYNIEGRTTLNDSRRTRSREMRSFSSRLTRFTRELFHVNTFQIWHIVKRKVSNRLLRFFFSFFLFLICMHNYVIIGLDKNPFVDEIMTKNLLNWIPCISSHFISGGRGKMMNPRGISIGKSRCSLKTRPLDSLMLLRHFVLYGCLDLTIFHKILSYISYIFIFCTFFFFYIPYFLRFHSIPYFIFPSYYP